TLESFARQPRALLSPDPARVEALRARIGPGPVTGISWRSFQKPHRRFYGEIKSTPLESLAPLVQDGVRLLDLQYGDTNSERTAFDTAHPGALLHLDELDTTQDLEGVLAAIEACTRVITTSNVTAHLAGAIGKETWLIYPGASPPFHYWAPIA